MTNLEMPPGVVGIRLTGDLEAWEKKCLAFLSFGLGIAQGCGLCFYVASGGYFSSVFGDERFFINACAFFYLPPIVTTLAQLLLDHRFDVLLGIRRLIRFRIYFSLFMVAFLLAALCWLADSTPYRGEGQLVYAVGAVLGIFAAVLLASACGLFGAIDPRLVPYLVLGQTFAGVYTNASARVLGFEPGCERWRAQAFFGLAAGSVGLGMLGYWSYNHLKLLESTYQRHESMLERSVPQNSFIPPMDLARSEVTISEQNGRRTCCGFPWICWSMAACQTLAIAMNMSLTPLANQIALGDYDLTQQLVLVKLLSDFVGRSAFLVLIPKPESRRRCFLRSVTGHAFMAWLLEAARLPVWTYVYQRALGSQLPFMVHHSVLLWVIWLPLVSTGALTSSWCFVIAVTAAPEAKRRVVNLLMSLSVYAGFASGIVVALLTR